MPNAWFIYIHTQRLIHSALTAYPVLFPLHSWSHSWAQCHHCKILLATCYISSSACGWIHNCHWSCWPTRTYFNCPSKHPPSAKQLSPIWAGRGSQISVPTSCHPIIAARQVGGQPTRRRIYHWHCRYGILLQMYMHTYVCIHSLLKLTKISWLVLLVSTYVAYRVCK